MPDLRIYGVARTRAFRALWIAKELDLDYEHVPVEIGPAGARKAEYLTINPNGRLPAIDMDLSAMPRIGDWLKRCLERPAARAARALRAEADAKVPVEVTRAIARHNRL